MSPSSLPHSLQLSTLLNARDLGGYPTADGGVTAYGRFIRADEPSSLSSEDLEALLSFPVTTVIDLRSHWEIGRRMTPFSEIPGIRYRNVSLFDSDPDDTDSPTVKVALSDSLGRLYIHVLTQAGEPVAEVFREILAAPPGGILFHCTHGKDRTGIIAALLLALAGVSREDIVRDYAITYDLIRPIVDPKIASVSDDIGHIFRSDRQNMEELLDYLDRTYDGNPALYFSAIGLTSEEILLLREQILLQKES